MRNYFFFGFLSLLIISCGKTPDVGITSYKELFTAIDNVENSDHLRKSIGISTNEKMADFQFKRKLKVFRVEEVNKAKYKKLEDFFEPDNDLYDLDLFHNPNTDNSILLKTRQDIFLEMGNSIPNSEGATKYCNDIPLKNTSDLDDDDLKKALMEFKFFGQLFNCTNCRIIAANERTYFQLSDTKWSELKLKPGIIFKLSDYSKKSITPYIDSLFMTYNQSGIFREIINPSYDVIL